MGSMNLVLRKVTESDSDSLLSWRNEETTIDWMGQRRALTQQEHNDWFKKALNDADLLLLIIEVDGIPTGQISYKISNENDTLGAAKVSINIASQFQRKGIATLAFKQGSEIVRVTGFAQIVFANVLPNNYGSIKAMENSGFKKIKMLNVNGKKHIRMTDEKGPFPTIGGG
jgi:RimJ/RimL family protein N-acetyltransferase